MKHVIQLLWDGHQGGVQRYVSKVATSKKWGNYQHSIVIIAEASNVINHKVSSMPVKVFNINTNTQLRKCYTALSEYISENKIGILHCHCGPPLFLSQLRLFKKHKLIDTEHRDRFVRSNHQVSTRFLLSCYGKYWDNIMQKSHFTERVFLNKFISLNCKTAVVHYPLLETKDLVPRSLNSKELHIGSVGKLEKVKELYLLLNAAPAILENKLFSHFYIFGDGSERQNLEDLTMNLGIINKVTFHGFTKSPLLQMQKMDCLVVPSRQESFGLVSSDAMSVDTPVVTFKNTGIADFLIRDQNDCLAEAGNIDSLINAINQNFTNQNNWLRLSENIQITVQNNNSLDKHINDLEEIYDEAFIPEQQKKIT